MAGADKRVQAVIAYGPSPGLSMGLILYPSQTRVLSALTVRDTSITWRKTLTMTWSGHLTCWSTKLMSAPFCANAGDF